MSFFRQPLQALSATGRRAPFAIVPVVLLALSGLPGCSYQKAREARSTAPELIGKSERELRACAGRPVKGERTMQGQWMSFYGDDSGTGRIPGGAAMDQGGSRYGSSSAGGRRYCKLDALVDSSGIVRDVRLTGSGGIGGRGFGCDDLLFRCR